MKKTFMAIFALVLAIGLSVGSAEAARMGGGKSVGMQRQSVAPRPAAPTQQASPAAPSQILQVESARPQAVRIATGDGGPTATYRFSRDTVYDPRHMVMFQHIEGARVCEVRGCQRSDSR